MAADPTASLSGLAATAHVSSADTTASTPASAILSASSAPVTTTAAAAYSSTASVNTSAASASTAATARLLGTVDSHFGGVLRSDIVCATCCARSTTLDAFTDLALSFPSTSAADGGGNGAAESSGAALHD